MIPSELVESRIYMLRGKRVMLDRNLAQLYGVSTGNLNKAIKRNLLRFPEDFMFQLNQSEHDTLVFQTGISKTERRGGSRFLPYAFTELGVAMLSSVLNSERAIMVNLQIMRTFTKLREMLSSHKELRDRINQLERKYDQEFKMVFDAIKKIIEPDTPPKQIGFRPNTTQNSPAARGRRRKVTMASCS